MSEIILPLVFFLQILLAKILSIKVAELLLTLVGLSIVGKNEQLCKESKKSLMKLQVSTLRRLMLKSPMI